MIRLWDDPEALSSGIYLLSLEDLTLEIYALDYHHSLLLGDDVVSNLEGAANLEVEKFTLVE